MYWGFNGYSIYTAEPNNNMIKLKGIRAYEEIANQ